MSSPAVPQHCPTPRELDDLELLVGGALAPITAFDEPGSPVTLSLPAELSSTETLELVDPEGLPLATVTGGHVAALNSPDYGPFRDLYLTPAQAQARYGRRTVVPVDGPLTSVQVADLGALGPIVLLALVGEGRSALSRVGLLRATLAAAAELPEAAVVAVPLARHPQRDLLDVVVANYAGDAPVRRPITAADELPVDVAQIVAADRPSRDRQGLVLFFTGLSGSGKSTLARALMDRLLEHGTRTVTSLDGDVVRRNLSAGLTFSREDRETNIRRIGWVAAEISRHGGVAVCSPIAPFDETRQQVRAMVDEARGAFFLVHVATPLEECERRDRKGLYAKARRGEIPEFTGISSPYEAPSDADVVVDTTGRTIEAALDDVLDALRSAGYLDLPPSPPLVEVRAPASHETKPPPSVEVRAPASHETNEPHQPLKVLFVCTANICRSPTMELLARELAGDADISFSSAGTHGFDAHPIDTEMAHTLASRGVDSESFLSRPVTRPLLEESDLVLTAETTHRSFLLDDHPGMFRKVFTLGQFAHGVASLDHPPGGAELLAHLGQHRPTADPAVDVRDPYRKGSEAAEEAAGQIEQLLRVVVPALVRSERISS